MQLPHIDPVFLRIGPLEFRWYGLMYILGFIAAYFIVLRRARKRSLLLSADDVADIIFYLAVGVILGGRLGYILFYNAPYYLEHPLKIFAVWEGGMSFHGGLIGVVLAGLLVARKKRLGFFTLADLCVLTAPVGLGLGRLGNFINGELYGRVTDMPWGVVFREGGPMPRHPSQLYEAILEGPVLFIILMVVGRKERPAGVAFWTFVSCYGLFRFFVEFFREPDSQLGFIMGPFSMGQLLSFPMFLLGLAMVLIITKKGKRTE
ncbi:prolipoprotein diacylglyceryl transferase [Geobacter metallireducens RCH3]|uniref:Phosphatidylglycerol--prolipoprotein diacylglyceryl transferase n=1 Tax=Geobacter metallireducens (strain ATCC 53774 / DSM 7210 / GS-15) TaxID=269799 RepID=Q39WB0_GEOMG|nr:prolipoprotein diacylglyceryl transferase [Geobacter metallireducens]ABB31464.1 prolipoprotein diacylglyceryl transferase [Geobacter metallireducens GS-15]EHP88449.1 prolipoprotein diacylglyceryl transferase [Geobacter metallireducens RCH3]